MTEDELLAEDKFIDELANSAIPDEVQDLLLWDVELPILSNEGRAQYVRMIVFLAKSIKPGDFIAWILVKDLTDHRIEIDRYRRLKIAILERAARSARSDRVSEVWSWLENKRTNLNNKAKKQKEEFAKQENSAAEVAKKDAEIDAELATAIASAEAEAKESIDVLRVEELTDDEFLSITTTSIDYRRPAMDSLERLDALLRSAEDRFIATVHEIERHLAGLGARFREELEAETRKVIDLVPSEGSRPGPAAGAKQAGLALSDRRKPQAQRRSRGGR